MITTTEVDSAVVGKGWGKPAPEAYNVDLHDVRHLRGALLLDFDYGLFRGSLCGHGFVLDVAGMNDIALQPYKYDFKGWWGVGNRLWA